MDRSAVVGARSQLLVVAAAMTLFAGMFQPRAAIAAAAPGVLYVDDSVPQSGDGSSWMTAYRFLQDALAFAAQPANGIAEIRLAQGIYKPDQGTGVTPGDADATFNIPSGVQLKGGYAGIGAPDPDARDIAQYESILSGDLLGNDVVTSNPQNWLNYNENSLHVATVLNGSPLTGLEGLVFTSSRMDFIGENFGGGLSVLGGSVQIIQCEFRHCRAYRGAAFGLKNCVATVKDCFTHENDGVYGIGGIFWAAQATVTNCLVKGNFHPGTGSGAGAGFGIQDSAVAISDCTFAKNVTQIVTYGGAIIEDDSRVTIDRCAFSQNGAEEGGAIAASGDVTIRDCVFKYNDAYWGGAISGKVKCYDSAFENCHAVAYGGALQSDPASLFVRCVFSDNRVSENGAGVARGGGTFVNCAFRGNLAYSQGAGVLKVLGTASFINCLFDGNVSPTGGGVMEIVPGGSAQIVNCALVSNSSSTSAGAIVCNGSASISNSVIWNNAGAGPFAGSLSSVQFSCVQGGWSGPGEGNIGADPLFISLLGQDGVAGTTDDDLRLMPGSPCIDAGSNLVLPMDVGDLDGDNDVQEPLPLDFDLLPRRVNDLATPDTGVPIGAALADIGPFEYQPKPVFGDVNGDGQVDIDDLFSVIDHWGECPNGEPQHCPADISPMGGDGAVDVSDLMDVIDGWT